MPGGMVFRKEWDFDQGNKLVTVNDLRDDEEVQEALAEAMEDADLLVEGIEDVPGLQEALDQIVADVEAAMSEVGDVAIFIDVDGVPYYSPGGPGSVVVMMDVDGVPYLPALV